MPKPWKTLFHFEAPEDGGGEDTAGDLDDLDIEGIDEEALEPAAPTEAEAASWALNQQEWETTVNYLQQTAPVLQQLAEALPYIQSLQQGPAQQQWQQPQQQYGQPQPMEIDPFDPSSVTAFIQQQIQEGVQAAVQQQIAPYTPVLDNVASEQGAALAKQELERIQADLGDFDRDTAFLIAAGSIEQGQDPAASLRQAAQYSKDFESRIRADERERFKEELKNLRSAPDESPVGGSAAREIQPVPTGPRRYHEVVERVLARQNPTSQVG